MIDDAQMRYPIDTIVLTCSSQHSAETFFFWQHYRMNKYYWVFNPVSSELQSGIRGLNSPHEMRQICIGQRSLWDILKYIQSYSGARSLCTRTYTQFAQFPDVQIHQEAITHVTISELHFTKHQLGFLNHCEQHSPSLVQLSLFLPTSCLLTRFWHSIQTKMLLIDNASSDADTE